MISGNVLSQLRNVRKTSGGWMALCPAHKDRNPSLSIKESDGGRYLLNCFAGCTFEQVLDALNLEHLGRGNGPLRGMIEVATYDYCDESGNLLFQVVRYDPKGFKQRTPDGNAGWQWNLKGVRRVLYRLPGLLRADPSTMIFICEGEKDCDRLSKLGLVSTTNPGGAGKWLDEYAEVFRGHPVCILPDNDETGRQHADKVAISLNGKASSFRILSLPSLPDKGDVTDWVDAGGTVEELQRLAWSQPTFEPKIKLGSHRYNVERVITDPRPKIHLPGPDRLLSDFAGELVSHLRNEDIYFRNGEVVTLTDGELRLLTPQSLRTWCEQFVIAYRSKRNGERVYEFGVTMRADEARGVLSSPQFISGLRRVRRVNHCRLPILNSDRSLMLLPVGYHAETQTLTLADVEYPEMSLPEAVETINSLLAEFCFAYGEQGKAVAVSAMVGLFVDELLPRNSLRPCFVFVANAEGAGKTLLVQIITTPTLGITPVGSKADDEDEIRKVLVTAVREACAVIFFDNLKGRLSSPALEAFLSAPVFTGRKLGVNESITADNLATVFVTGNGLSISPDMRRRSLFIELHLEAERAEDRQFKRMLDLPTLLEIRPTLLAALWALVSYWDTLGRPEPSRSHSAFPSWAKVVGGIVEAAGFGCSLETAHVSATADPEVEDMRALASALAAVGKALTFAELVALARDRGLFETIIGRTEDKELSRSEKTAFSRLLTRYDRRLVRNFRFLVEGKGKTRRYKVERVENDRDDRNDISDGRASPYNTRDGQKHHADHSDHSDEIAERAAIIEFDGGVSREEEETLVRLASTGVVLRAG